MTFSDTVAQQREKQATALKRFVMASLAGSVVLHSGGLFLKVSHLWQADEPASEEITIVVTPEEEGVTPTDATEMAVAPETPGEPTTTAEFSSPTIETFSEPTVVQESTVAPVESTPEDPVAEEPPLQEPLTEEEPTPIAEDVTPTETATESTEDNSDEPSQTALPESDTRNLSDLLAELRRARQQGNSSPSGTSQQTGISGNPTSENTGGVGNGTATAAAPTSSITPPASTPTRQGRRSREITCTGCEFDYPEAADGAEGTAQVIVETDDQGRVISVMLSRSSGNAALDRAALEQARRRVRLSNARAGESYPIDIDFVQPNSEAAQRVRERGDRRSITVDDPEPTAETPTSEPPASAAVTTPSPTPESTITEEGSPTPEPSSIPDASPAGSTSQEPATPAISEPRPVSTPVTPQPSTSRDVPEPRTSEPAPESRTPEPAPEPRASEPVVEPDTPPMPPSSPPPPGS
ncbi:TonB family protein [Oscillatoria sp. FACHB-1407]|uniref:energy transducer TonB family protein n=1 Tax=Oscillatoria sp. FACHB-1407 TaxID=2692847 RepID=UPI0016863E62|nr:energy transducer TonB [Oscillatoria sp. FACHB-1407]MBD2463183.1 TonB family protein [Oscillatoria sp. FACHB-1407]